MSDIPIREIPPLLLRMIPESADSIAEMFHRPAEAAVLTEDAAVMLYELLAGCFTTPVLMPQLESDSPDTELLTRCWDFVELLDGSGDVFDGHVRIDAVLVEDVDVVDAQVAQAVVGDLADVLLAAVEGDPDLLGGSDMSKPNLVARTNSSRKSLTA